ncbi:hypothetical protein TYRP_011870 [Tyrophagus putrescentiae]|nr:hypothetical protein TYRP_011870 [Tyrophagus putrescentiae]
MNQQPQQHQNAPNAQQAYHPAYGSYHQGSMMHHQQQHHQNLHQHQQHQQMHSTPVSHHHQHSQHLQQHPLHHHPQHPQHQHHHLHHLHSPGATLADHPSSIDLCSSPRLWLFIIIRRCQQKPASSLRSSGNPNPPMCYFMCQRARLGLGLLRLPMVSIESTTDHRGTVIHFGGHHHRRVTVTTVDLFRVS